MIFPLKLSSLGLHGSQEDLEDYLCILGTRLGLQMGMRRKPHGPCSPADKMTEVGGCPEAPALSHNWHRVSPVHGKTSVKVQL